MYYIVCCSNNPQHFQVLNMPLFSFYIATSLVWMDVFKNIWTPTPTPEGVKSKKTLD